MFAKNVYMDRRQKLRDQVGDGLILFLGNEESAMNYPANTYHFRQDSHFLYFFGVDVPGLVGLIDIDNCEDTIFGEDFTVDDIVWMGPQPTMKEFCTLSGSHKWETASSLTVKLEKAIRQGRRIHFLPPYRAENSHRLADLLGISCGSIPQYVSIELIRAVVNLRSIKSEIEIAEIERALKITKKMYLEALKLIRPGLYEREIVGRMEAEVGSAGCHFAFPIILTVHGETLHNHYHGNRMEEGQLLIIDTGSESPERYASDITRTFPVSGKFSPQQKDIYEVVLSAQLTAIEAMKPGVRNRDIHLGTATVIASGLKDAGLIKGNVDDAVKEGAHALFFPHGLGHMMGLDVHDMEDLGENFVGYDDTVQRSDQFGLAYLRMAKELQPNHVLTVEPGIYFIPALIDKWRSENKLAQFINYDRLDEFKSFGGIRIEDDVLVTPDGSRVLGEGIPKLVDDIQSLMD